MPSYLSSPNFSLSMRYKIISIIGYRIHLISKQVITTRVSNSTSSKTTNSSSKASLNNNSTDRIIKEETNTSRKSVSQ